MKAIVLAFAAATVFFSAAPSALTAGPFRECNGKSAAACGNRLPRQSGGDEEYAKYQRMPEFIGKSAIQKAAQACPVNLPACGSRPPWG